MKKNRLSILYFISAGLFGVAAILNFTDNKSSIGFTYICLAFTFAAIGFTQLKGNS